MGRLLPKKSIRDQDGGIKESRMQPGISVLFEDGSKRVTANVSDGSKIEVFRKVGPDEMRVEVVELSSLTMVSPQPRNPFKWLRTEDNA